MSDQSLHDEYSAAIGRVAETSAIIEFEIVELLSILIDCAPEKVALLVGSRGLHDNIQLCLLTIKLMLKPDPRLSAIREMLEELIGLVAERNKIVHGITVISSDGDLQAYRKAARKRKTVDLWVEAYGIVKIKSVADRLELSHNRLIVWMRSANIEDQEFGFRRQVVRMRGGRDRW